MINDTLRNTKFEIQEEIKNKAEIPVMVKKTLLYFLQKANFQRFYAKFCQNYDTDGMQDLIIDSLVSNTVRTVAGIDKDYLSDIIAEVVFEVIPPVD